MTFPTQWTVKDLDTLNRAIGRGVKHAQYEGKGSVTYHDLAEMLRVRDLMVAALTAQGLLPSTNPDGSNPRPNSLRSVFGAS